MAIGNPLTGSGGVTADGELVSLLVDTSGALQITDMPLTLGGETEPLASIALNTAGLTTAGTQVPDGSTYVFQAYLQDNPSALVLLRVDPDTGQSATTTSTAQRFITHGAKVVVAGPCYVYPLLIEADGTAATATANDKLLRSKL